MKKAVIFSLCVAAFLGAFAQQTKSVLFLGNSYTGVNNLPQMVANVALSLGDTLIFESNTPGGYTLNGHSTNATSQAKIAQGGWDFVVLQEQSQLPAFPYTQFSTASLPYSVTLCNQIRAADSCAKPLFYMTWGRKNGDQPNCINYPPLCTYAGMQGELRERYLLMADTNYAAVAPVGAAWRDLRATKPNIELYDSDESHPSLEGSYLAACTFYASIFNKSPVGAGIPGLINATDAQAIQQQAAQTVFDSLTTWMIDTLKPEVKAVYTIISGVPGNCIVDFDASTSINVDSVFWDFQDGTFGSGFQIQHSFSVPGIDVLVTGFRNCDADQDTLFHVTLPCWWSIDENTLPQISVYPNPATDLLRVAQYNEPLARGQYKIYALTGQLLQQGKLETAIEIQNIAAGSYILVIEKSGKQAHIPFTKT